MGETRIKGLNDPLHVFELDAVGRVHSRLDASRACGFTKFVGRQSEVAALEAALERAIAGNAQVVGVVAEALIGQLRDVIRADAPFWTTEEYWEPAKTGADAW